MSREDKVIKQIWYIMLAYYYQCCKIRYFGHQMQRANLIEKSLLLGKTEGWRSGWQRLVLSTQWAWSLSRLVEIVKGREAWHAAVHGVTKSGTQLSSWTFWRWLRWWRICLQCSRPAFDPWVRRIPWRAWHPTPVFLPGDFHGQRSLVGYIHGVTKSLTWLSH